MVVLCYNQVMSLYKKFSFLFIITVILFSVVNFVHADQLSNAQADKARLEAELSNLEAEIAQKQKELEGQQGNTKSLKNDINILTTKIKQSKLDIQAKNLTIKKLGGEITQKNTVIRTLTENIQAEKESLAQLIRKNREIDDITAIGFLLSNETISETYGDIDTFASLKQAIRKSVNRIAGIRTETEVEKKTLEQKKNKEIDVKVALENAKRQIEKNESEKQQLLSISKNKEAEYQKLLADKAKRRSEILSALFNLRDTGAISFGKALEYANFASSKTNVATAFILAIITQESNLGTDQGSCYVTNFTTGEGVSSKSNKFFKNVMKPTRDVVPFQAITASVGRDPYKTLVSCPIASAGANSWGGAMGPAQFIPSTWNGIKGRIASALGKTSADPWNAKDAFMASAIFLSDLGATGDSYTSQIKAACKYYGTGGTSCAYGRQVMAKMKNIQEKLIDPLQNS